MADPSTPEVGVLGGLPPLPRKPLNASALAAEQAYRKRKGMPLLSDADIEALKAGVPTAWEQGGAGATTPIPAPTSAAAGVTVPSGTPAQPAAVPSQPTGGAVSGIQGGLPNLPRKALNPSVRAAEQAYRKKKGLAVLTE